MQQRFIVAKKERVGNVMVPVRGHFIGPGKRSVVSIIRNAQINLIHNLRRAAAGRYNWWNLTDIAKTNAPDELPSRQVRRKQARQDNKLWASSNRHQPVAIVPAPAPLVYADEVPMDAPA